MTQSQQTIVGEVREITTMDDQFKLSVRFRAVNGTRIRETFTATYSESLNNVNKYNHNLAKCSLALSISAFSAGDITEHWGEDGDFGRDKRLKASFDELDLKDQSFVGYDKSLNSDGSKVAFGIGRKSLSYNGEECELLVVAIRGGGYGAEWSDNFSLGKRGKYHKGFEKAADSIKLYIDNFINLKCKGKRINLWITGFSRGGAVANILASKYNEYISEKFSVFAYTFASPNTVIKEQKSSCSNIFNIVNSYDTITSLPPYEWGFRREGVDLYLPFMTENQRDITKFDAVSDILLQITGETYNLINDNKMESIKNVMLTLSGSRESFSKNYEPLFKDMMSYFMTKVKKDKWVRIGFKEFLINKYSNKAKKAYDKIKDNSGLMFADEVGIKIPDEIIDYIVLTELHNLNTSNKFMISSLKVETIKNLWYSFSDELFKSGAKLHSPETYLAWLIIYNFEE